MSEILRCENLSKSYGKTLALDNISLTLEGGKIIGLLGPNGSGKTTLIKLRTREEMFCKNRFFPIVESWIFDSASTFSMYFLFSGTWARNSFISAMLVRLVMIPKVYAISRSSSVVPN